MVTELIPPTRICGRILLTPNCSLSQRGNLLACLPFFLLTLPTTLLFTAMGAWLVLPFTLATGAALAAVLLGLRRRLETQEMVCIDETSVAIEKGAQQLEQRWEFARAGLHLLVQPSGAGRDAQRLMLSGDGGLISVGAFLNSADQRRLLDSLRRHGLKSRAASSCERLNF